MSEQPTDETLHLTDWLKNQKERAEERIEDERVGEKETWRWKGERDLIDSIQRYLEKGVLENCSVDTDTYWYKSRGNKHYFLQAEERAGWLFFRKVSPLISQDNRGYYRVHQWKRVSDDMVDAFHEDHRERDPPSDWENARKEDA